MDIKKVNPVKTRIFNLLTGSFQNTGKSISINSDPNTPINILITRPNHRLGNQLLISPLIQELKHKFPKAKIDLVVNGNLAPVLFSEFECIENIYNLPKKPFNNILRYIRKTSKMMAKKYDISIAGNEKSNSSKIFVKLSRSKNKIYNSGAISAYKPRHISKIPIYNLLRFFNPSADLKNYRYPKLSINLSKKEIEQGDTILEQLFRNKKQTICVFTYATGKKRHSREWWLNFYSVLKNEFKNYNILEVLPKENVSQIDFQSVHFYSQDLREIASIIENCTVFIGADSGMMHLSASTGTSTVGLFNVTDPEIYAPYGNKNGWVNTNTSKIAEIIERVKLSVLPDESPRTAIESKVRNIEGT